MIGLAIRAAAAVARAVRNPALRKAVVDAARKVGSKASQLSRSAVQSCKIWQRNRAIRQAYNARKAVLKSELKQMQKQGASKDQMAKRAFDFRKSERLRAREEMIKNGDKKLVERLEARDLQKYGSKDGPTYKHLQQKAQQELIQKGVQSPSRDQVAQEIIESSTRTDLATNLKFLTF